MPGAAPLCLAMILCDHVHRDAATGKCTLLGTFSTINARGFPAFHPNLSVYLQLTDGHQDCQLSLKVSRVLPDELDGELLFSADFPVVFKDRWCVVELHLNVNNLLFDEAGEYQFTLESQGILVMERTLLVRDMSKPEAP